MQALLAQSLWVAHAAPPGNGGPQMPTAQMSGSAQSAVAAQGAAAPFSGAHV